MPPRGEEPTERRFSNMPPEDEDYINKLLAMIADGKPYIIAAGDNKSSIKYAMGGMSRKEQMYFLAKINLARAEKLIEKDDE